MSSVVLKACRIIDLQSPGEGAVGWADALIALAADAPVTLAWDGESCAVRHAGAEFTTPLGKSAVRAVIARVAALCDEAAPDTLSPYGGAGVIKAGGRRVRAEFVNTMHEQRLHLTPA